MLKITRTFLYALVLAYLFTVAVSAGSSADAVVGFYTSSTGTPVKIAYAGDEQKVLLQFGAADMIEGWLTSGRDGKITITYVSGDGTTMMATQANPKSISVTSQSSSFKATWRRN